MLKRCIEAKEQDDRLQSEVLLYHQHTALHGSVDYNHFHANHFYSCEFIN